MDKKKILIIDDEIRLCKVIKIELEHAGYDVMVAHDGLEGFNKVKQEIPDLIILDVMLPHLDGFHICRMLKFDGNFKDIPVLLLTAKGQSSDKLIGQEVKADAYITKPFKSEDVLDCIKSLLEKVPLK